MNYVLSVHLALFVLQHRNPQPHPDVSVLRQAGPAAVEVRVSGQEVQGRVPRDLVSRLEKVRMSAAEDDFAARCAVLALSLGEHAVPVREYRFHPERRWRLDFAWPSIKLGVEIQGMGMGGRAGGHQTDKGMQNDCEKHNALVQLGWRVLHFRAGDRRNVASWVETVREVMCAQ